MELPETGVTPDGLIFDLDGTLWDATDTVAAAWTRALRHLGEGGRVITAADIAAVMGKTHGEICTSVFPGLAEARRDVLVRACYAEEERLLRKRGGRLYPGVASGLSVLANRFRLFIVSNCQRGYIETFLACYGLAPLFTDSVCHGDTGSDKAENLRRLIARNALAAPLYVGDTDADRIAAECAGVPFIHARYGFGTMADGCTAIDAFGQLADALLPAR